MDKPRYRLVNDNVQLDGALPIRAYQWTVPDSRIPFLHTHNTFELGVCLGGAGLFVVGTKVFEYSAGFACAINPGDAHLASTITADGSPWYFVDVDPAGLLSPWNRTALALADTRILSHPGFPNVMGPDTDPVIPTLVKLLAEETMAMAPNAEHAVRGLALAVLARLHGLAGTMARGDSGLVHSGALGRLAPAIAFVSSHYQDDITVADMADVCGLSPSQLRRNFRALLDKSPLEYLDGYRVGVAATLLRNTEMSVLEISGMVGFGSVSSLNRLFREAMGDSPAAWRRRLRG